MQPISLLLSLPAVITNNLKLISICTIILIAIIAFIVGFSKGFSRLSWGALVWAFICAAWIFVEIKFHDKNPIVKICSEKSLSTDIVNLIGSTSVLLCSILIGLFVFGILAAICRPKRRKRAPDNYYFRDEDKKKNKKNDDAWIDEDEENEEKKNAARGEAVYKGMTKAAVKKYKPKFFNRLIGGLVGIVECAIVIGAIAGIALVFIEITSLKSNLSAIYDNETFIKVWPYLSSYALETLFAAAMIAAGYYGYRHGFIHGFRSMFKVFGIIGIIVAAAMIPSTQIRAAVWLNDYFTKLFTKMFGSNAENLASILPVFGKIATGLVVLLVGILIVVIINAILAALTDAVRHSATLRVIDGVLSSLCLILLTFLAIIIIMALCYIIITMGWGLEKFQTIFFGGEKSYFSKGIYILFQTYLQPYLDKAINYV